MTASIGPHIRTRWIVLMVLAWIIASWGLSAYVERQRVSRATNWERQWCVEWDKRTVGDWAWDGERCVIDE